MLPSFLTGSMSSGKKQKQNKKQDLYTCFQAGGHLGRGEETLRELVASLPPPPLPYPWGQQGNWKNRTSAWRAPSAPREGAEEGLQTRGLEWGYCRS